MNNNNNIIVPAKYQEASIRFREAWLEYIDKEELVKFEAVNMIKILEKVGYSRTAAINKVVDDHKDLKGFSRRNIYRELPDEMKQDNSLRDLKSLREDHEVTNKPLDVPFGTNESINITTAYDLKDAETTTGQEEEDDNILEGGGAVFQSPDNNDEEEKEQDEIYDKQFVDRLIKENAQLVAQFTFEYDLEVKDQILPLKIIVYPDKQTGVVRLRKK